MYIDLHMHTKNSDGNFSTAELLKMCEEANLQIISITDHDSVLAYTDIAKENLTFNGKIIKGTELSFGRNGRIYDILGYGIDLQVTNDWLKSKYPSEISFKNQDLILNDMKKLYSSMGLKFADSLAIVRGVKSEAYNLMKASVMSFKENELIAPEFWAKNFYKVHHTNINSKFYIDETRFTATINEAIDIIHKAGGKAVLAHSGAYGFSYEEMKEFIEFAINAGIDGLELKYNCHTKEHEELINSYAKKHNLLLTGGSDFHGGRIKPDVKLGKVYGDVNINEQDVSLFLNQMETESKNCLTR